MLALLCAAAAAFFVPYARTSRPIVQSLTDQFATEFQPTTVALVTLVVPADDPALAAQCIARVARISVVLAGLTDFGVVSMSAQQTFTRALPFDLPGLVFFLKGTPFTSSDFSSSDADVTTQILDWIDPELDLIDNRRDLFAFLGGTPLSLIVAEPHTGRAPSLLWTVLPHIELCNIVRVKSNVIEKVGFENVTHVIYRRADQTMVAIENSTVGIYNASYPYFGRLDSAAFGHERLICVYFDEVYDEQRHALMYDVAANFTEIQFGVLERSDFHVLDRLGLKHDVVPDTLIVRYFAGGYYPTDTMQGLVVGTPEWAEKVGAYAGGVLNRSVPIYYRSEMPQLDDRDGLITRLVGSTFEAFLEDNKTDAVIMFYADPDGENISTEFQAAVTAVFKGGTTMIRFAHINVWKNACERRFPTLLSNPHLVIFPATNRSNSIPYLGPMQQIPLLRFLKARATVSNKIEVAPITPEEAKNEKAVIEGGIGGLPDWAVAFAQEEITRLELVINASLPAPSGTASAAPSPPPSASPSATPGL